MHRTLIAVAALSLTFALAPAHAATSQSDTYAVPSGIGGAVAVSCTQCLTAAGLTVNIGGANFAPPGGAWLTVSVEDASGGPVSFSVGQDFNGDGISDLSFAFCGTDADVSGRGFDSEVVLSVFVDNLGIECANVASSGTITVTSA